MSFLGPLFIPLRKPFHKVAVDKDLGRPDRRLAIAQPQWCALCARRETEDALLQTYDGSKLCDDCYCAEVGE